MKTRYVITKVDRNGLRVLATANHGRCHHDDKADAEKMLRAMLANNSADTLRSVYGDVSKMKVLPVECYDHGDATRTVFDMEPPEQFEHDPRFDAGGEFYSEANEVPETYLTKQRAGWVLIHQGMPLCADGREFAECMAIAARAKLTVSDRVWIAEESRFGTLAEARNTGCAPEILRSGNPRNLGKTA